MGKESDLETAESVKDNLREQLEQQMNLIKKLAEELKEIENEIAAKRAEIYINKLELIEKEVKNG